jgi:ATP-dependent RNA helicase DDX27
MTDNVDQLIRLSLNHPVRLFVDSRKSTSHRLEQEFIRIRPNREEDRPAILLALCKRSFKSKCIVFVQSKLSAHQMKIIFGLHGLNSAELHGNLTQEQRMDALEQFRDGQVDFLLATDLAARGIDVKGVDTVINYNMPSTHAQYLHRVGRTARAGRTGRSVSFVAESDRKILRSILKHTTSGDQIKHRMIPANIVEKYRAKLDACKEDVKTILEEEKEEKSLRDAEQQLSKAQNMIDHHDEIMSRPKREWFQSVQSKEKAKLASANDKLGKSGEEEVGSKKNKRSATDGMSRKKKRKLLNQEDEGLLKSSLGSVKRAKKDHRPNRMLTTAIPKDGSKKSMKKKKFTGFKSDLSSRGHSESGSQSRPKPAKKKLKMKKKVGGRK